VLLLPLLLLVERGKFRVVKLRRPHDVAVEVVDGGSPRVRAERVRVARERGPAARLGLGLAGRSRGEHLLRRLVLPRGLGRRRSGAREPRVGFGAPAAAVLVGAESLPVHAADVGVVDRAAEGGLEGGRLDRIRVFARGRPDGLGDKRTVPNRVEVCSV